MLDNKKEICTGCGACFNICPKGAIRMNLSDGFYKPIIDKSLCVNCGLCEKVCPLDNYKSENDEKPKVYAFQNPDKDILKKCASGGAFAAIAKYYINNNSVVYGVAYNDDLQVCHVRVDNKADLEKLYSSKYVQSYTSNIFSQTKQDLDEGKNVLFSGTPCQIAGLKSFLQKDYSNLLTVELICHGVPSPIVFEKYKEELKTKFKKGEKLLNINFRSKIAGWGNFAIIAISTNKSIKYFPAFSDIFSNIFSQGLSVNSSCEQCQFNKLPRTADIAIGDFWGVDNYDKSLNDLKGISIILINNSKGQDFFNRINQTEVREIPLEYVIKYNPNVTKASKLHSHKKEFMQEVLLNNYSLSKLCKKYVKKKNVLIKSLYYKLPLKIQAFIRNKFLRG